MQRGLVRDADGKALTVDHVYQPSFCVRYFREVERETPIPFGEQIVHADADLVVADKPHFLPVVPAGRFVRETLLTRLIERFDNPHLVPLHRIDRATAGLVLFSANRLTRSSYQALFREQRIIKRYEALAPPLPHLTFPLTYRSRLVPGEPFFRMREASGAANSETRIDVDDRRDDAWHYILWPVTGRKHQLRVHMAALGAPICNDRFYPELVAPNPTDQDPDDLRNPLKLLAQSLAFPDPLTGAERRFESSFRL